MTTELAEMFASSKNKRRSARLNELMSACKNGYRPQKVCLLLPLVLLIALCGCAKCKYTCTGTDGPSGFVYLVHFQETVDDECDDSHVAELESRYDDVTCTTKELHPPFGDPF